MQGVPSMRTQGIPRVRERCCRHGSQAVNCAEQKQVDRFPKGTFNRGSPYS